MATLNGATLRRWLLPAAGLLALAALLAAACGGGTTDSGQTPAPATFDISLADSPSGGGSAAEFQPKEFTVAAGQKVTFNIANAGQAVHTMRIAGRDNEYGTGDDAVVEPYTVYASQRGVLTWTAPKEPGTYNFRCDFHLESVGTVVVK